MAEIIKMGNKTKMRKILFKCDCGCVFKEEYSVCKHFDDGKRHSTTCPCCGKRVEVSDEHYAKQCHLEYEEEKRENPDYFDVEKIKRTVHNNVDFEGRDTTLLDKIMYRVDGPAGENEFRQLLRKHKITIESLIGRPYKFDINLNFSIPDLARLGVQIYELIYPTKFPRNEEYLEKRQMFVKDFILYSNDKSERGTYIFWPYLNVIENKMQPSERTIELWNEFKTHRCKNLMNSFTEEEMESLRKFLCVRDSLSILVDEHKLDFDGVWDYILFNEKQNAFCKNKDYSEMTHNEYKAKVEKEKNQIEKYVELKKKLDTMKEPIKKLEERKEELVHFIWGHGPEKMYVKYRAIDLENEKDVDYFLYEQLYKNIEIKYKNRDWPKVFRIHYVDFQKVMKERFEYVKTRKFVTSDLYSKLYEDAENEEKEIDNQLKELRKNYNPIYKEFFDLKNEMSWNTQCIAESKI